MASSLNIPLISLSKSVPADLLDAMATSGFLHLDLEGTNLSALDVQKAFDLSAYYYNIPEVERKRFPRDEDYNGLVALGNSALAAEYGQSRADWKEGFGYGRFSPPKTRSDQALPAQMDSKREELQWFWEQCYELMLRILDMLARAFQVPVYLCPWI